MNESGYKEELRGLPVLADQPGEWEICDEGEVR